MIEVVVCSSREGSTPDFLQEIFRWGKHVRCIPIGCTYLISILRNS